MARYWLHQQRTELRIISVHVRDVHVHPSRLFSLSDACCDALIYGIQPQILSHGTPSPSPSNLPIPQSFK